MHDFVYNNVMASSLRWKKEVSGNKMNAGQLGDNCKRCGTPLSWICFFVLFCFLFFCCGFVYVRDLRDTWKGKHRLDWCVDHGKIRVGGFKQRRWLSFEPPCLESRRKPWSPPSWYHGAQPCVPSRPGLHRAGSGQAVPWLFSLKLPSRVFWFCSPLRHREKTVHLWTDLEM